MAAGHPFPQREGTRLARSPQPGWSPVRSKRTGDAKGCVQPFATLCNLPSSSLSLSPPFPAPRNGDETKRRIDVQLQTLDLELFPRGDRPAFTYKSATCKAAVIWRERERERERERAGFRWIGVDERPMSGYGHNLFNDCYDCYDAIDPETKRRVPLDCVTRREERSLD